jgi:3-oxoacyl-[acyl-carrier protein] reductase
VWGLTKALAREFGPQGVTTNIISPGTIVGEFEDPVHPRDLNALQRANPVGRLGTPLDIASMVKLLVSEEGGFVNGQMLQINGGVVN